MSGDCITLKGIRVSTHIGVPDEERALPQTLEVDVEMHMARPLSGLSDQIEKTMDYYTVWQRIRALAAERERKLIETLAEEIVSELLEEPAIERVGLEIRKFILPDTTHVSVQMTRGRLQKS